MEKKILIVEDNADSRDVLALLLKSYGYTVYSADNGREGLKLVEQDCPDLIVTDISMPDMDGIAMVRALRDWPQCDKVPIVVLSAYGSGDLNKAIRAGADQSLRKPIDVELLVKAIERLLD